MLPLQVRLPQWIAMFAQTFATPLDQHNIICNIYTCLSAVKQSVHFREDKITLPSLSNLWRS